MAKFSSTLLALLVAALVALSAQAFAPQRAFVARPPSQLAVNIKVSVGDGEPIESAIRRFKREVSKSGHLMELRHRKHFENSQEKRKRKIKEGRMRAKFERMQRRRMANRT